MDMNQPFGPRSGYFECKNKGCDNKVYHRGYWDEKINGVECVKCMGERLTKKLRKKDGNKDG